MCIKLSKKKREYHTLKWIVLSFSDHTWPHPTSNSSFGCYISFVTMSMQKNYFLGNYLYAKHLRHWLIPFSVWWPNIPRIWLDERIFQSITWKFQYYIEEKHLCFLKISFFVLFLEIITPAPNKLKPPTDKFRKVYAWLEMPIHIQLTVVILDAIFPGKLSISKKSETLIASFQR